MSKTDGQELLAALDQLCDQAQVLLVRANHNEHPITAEVLTTLVDAVEVNWMAIRRELRGNS